MAQPSKLARVQSCQGGVNASSSGTSGPAQLSGDTDEPSPFNFLNYVPSPVTEQDTRRPQAPELPHVPQSTGDLAIFDFLDHIPSSVGPPQSMGPPRSISAPIALSGPPVSTASAVGQSTYAFLDFLPSPLSDRYRYGAPGIARMPSTASTVNTLAPCVTPVPTAATHGVQHTDTSPRWLVRRWSDVWLPAISAAAQHPTAYNFLQHIPASQRMTQIRPPVCEEEDREMEQTGTACAIVYFGALAGNQDPYPPASNACSVSEVAVVLDAHTGSSVVF
ncbi:hypothetical protein EI94DRAFT_1807188 [Lactarius quietus]|nr:hypothetical protein EI94DRAFT_1807188 [Lactarius quietus]